MLVGLLIAMTLFVAYANGANDNFKGVATLYGSGTTSFKAALWIGTLATFAGCVSSVFLAETLVKAFSGKGLVPDAIAASPPFLAAVASGAALTVMLATVTGFPISTTHALTGALAGAGFTAAGSQFNPSVLGTAFFLPLLVSPMIALLLAMPLYKLAHIAVQRGGLRRDTVVVAAPQNVNMSYLLAPAEAGVRVSAYEGRLLGLSASALVDGLHYLSGIAVSFARGLNDTPKIVALLLSVKAFDLKVSMLGVALAMGLGGLLNARKVAETMSRKIATMNEGQALTANLVTSFLVIFASRIGVPVSTTHCSVGAISGVGLIKGTADKSVIGAILLSWLLTLPAAALIAATTYWAIAR